jgi:Big-like domain-containing protein
MLTLILAAIQQFLLGLISLSALIAIIVSIIVTGHPPGNPPTATSASIITNEDTASTPVTPSVSDPDAGDTFTFSIVTQPANGTAAVVNNQLVYTPVADYNGPDSFTFRATDSTNLSVVGSASVTILAVNDPPSVADLSIFATEDAAGAPVTPAVSDADIGDTHTFTVVSQPGRGLATVVGNQLVYTPDANFSGQDSFIFRATDFGGLAAIAAANVTVAPVADAPSATRAGITARAGTPGSPVTPYVEDADLWDSFSHQVLSAPANGTASVVGNQLVYVPNPGFVIGLDSFAYRATGSDGLTIDGMALVRVYSAVGFSRCTSPSTVNANGTLNLRTLASPCGFYGEVQTRTTQDGTPVIVRYIAHRPSNGASPKAVVFLIGGADLDMSITGDATTGAITTSGGNFLVRTSQLFANAGYLAIAMDRPTDRPSATPSETVQNVDEYRISVDHAVDILAVLKQVNTDNLDVFLSGTSKGALSAVANNLIAAGISLSSAVTRRSGLFPDRLFINDPGVPSLQPSFVQRPAHVLLNTNDLCPVTQPVDSQALFDNLTAAGVSAAIDAVSGGVPVTVFPAPDVRDVCGALDFHGYMSIEPTAVGRITAWLDGRVAALAGNRRPDAAFATVATAAGIQKQINLSTLTRDLDGDTLSYALSHSTTSRGGSVSLAGSMATYTPPVGASSVTDYFVYVVADGKGGVGAAVIAVEIGS